MSATRVIAVARRSGDGGGLAMLRAAADRGGDVLISFRSGVGPRPRVWLRRWRRDGSRARLLAVSPHRHAAGFYNELASDRDGDAVVVWTRSLPLDRFAVYGRHVSRADRLGPVARLGRGDFPDVAVGDDGDGIAVWHAPDDDVTNAVRGRAIRRTGGFGAVRTIARGGRFPQVAAAPRGSITAIWQRNAAPYRIQAAVLPRDRR